MPAKKKNKHAPVSRLRKQTSAVPAHPVPIPAPSRKRTSAAPAQPAPMAAPPTPVPFAPAPAPERRKEGDTTQFLRRETERHDGDTSIRLYHREIGQEKLLTPQEEIELAAKIKRGDKKAREH